ncbi:MAG TPA: hypothetical protein VGN88_10995 [Phycisphaerae bacterium]|jgi:hypothetical protein
MKISMKSLMLAMVLLLVPAACDIQHITELRESQNEFNTIVTQENLHILHGIYPTSSQLLTEVSNSQYLTSTDALPINFVTANAAQQSYENLYLRLSALIKNREGQLRSDRLLNQALTLRILAKSRATLYGNLADIGRPTTTQPGAAPPLPATQAEVAQEADELARALLAQKDTTVGTRDLFILQTMHALIRNNIAFVGAVQLMKSVPDNNTGNASANALVLQFITASHELSEVQVADAEQMEEYRLLSRFVMLQNANTLSGHYENGGHRSAATEPQLKEEIDIFTSYYNTGGGKQVNDNLKPPLDFSLLGTH